ncbi:MAG: hypothetical protein HY319_23195 [Armatimonadetes bacterium]|nr:hypothetical protein [Armatimonadota bacterium]
MQFTSAEFRKHNQVLFAARILPHPRAYAHEAEARPSTDAIDLNHNRWADIETVIHERYNPGDSDILLKPSEPTLDVPLDVVKKHADAHGTQVVTQDDVKEITISRYDRRQPGWCASLLNEPISALIPEVLPLEKDPKAIKWAIDVHTQELIFFAPGA